MDKILIPPPQHLCACCVMFFLRTHRKKQGHWDILLRSIVTFCVLYWILSFFQATAEQIRLAQMIYDKNDADFEDKVKQVCFLLVQIFLSHNKIF